MNAIFRTTLLALAVSGLVACRDRTPDAPKAASGHTIEGDVTESVSGAMAEARRKLATENITINEHGGRKAEITPDGDLLIDGKPIRVDANQRRMLLEHRRQIISIAEAGMGIGVQGAKLATRAMTEAITGIFSGEPERIEKRVEAQAQDIKQAARALCDRLPAMYASQQKLAAAIPEFAPFAKMEPKEIDHCRKGIDDETPPAAPAAPAAPSAPPAPVTGDAGVDTTA